MLLPSYHQLCFKLIKFVDRSFLFPFFPFEELFELVSSIQVFQVFRFLDLLPPTPRIDWPGGARFSEISESWVGIGSLDWPKTRIRDDEWKRDDSDGGKKRGSEGKFFADRGRES